MTVKTIVSSEHPPESSRCTEIRERLDAFIQMKLGPVARGEVQGHLLECDSCGELYSELVLERVQDGTVPTVAPASIPSPELYDAYLRARRVAEPWRAVLDALVDPESRGRAMARIEEIRLGLHALVRPPRTAAAVRTRSTVTPPMLLARVMTAAAGTSEMTVTFRVQTPPSIAADGRFRFELQTDDIEYAGRTVRCEIALDAGAPLVFEAVSRRHGHGGCEVVFDEQRLPAHGKVPLDRITLIVT